MNTMQHFHNLSYAPVSFQGYLLGIHEINCIYKCFIVFSEYPSVWILDLTTWLGVNVRLTWVKRFCQEGKVKLPTMISSRPL